MRRRGSYAARGVQDASRTVRIFSRLIVPTSHEPGRIATPSLLKRSRLIPKHDSPVISIMNDVVVSILGCDANWRPHTAHAAPTAAQLEYTSQSKGRPSEMKWNPPR